VLLIETVPRPIPVRVRISFVPEKFFEQAIQNAAGQSGVASDLVGIFVWPVISVSTGTIESKPARRHEADVDVQRRPRTINVRI